MWTSGRRGLVITLGLLLCGAVVVGLVYLGRFHGGPSTDGNGGFVTTSVVAGQVEITQHPLREDGSVADPLLVYRGPGDERMGPLAMDGVGDAVLLGWSLDGPSTLLQVRSAGDAALVRQIPAPGWCSVYSDGPDKTVCLLLDGQRLLRTTAIAPGTGQAASVMIYALDSGQQLGEFGSFPALEAVLGTASPDTVLLVQAGPGGGKVAALDLSTGAVTLIGSYDQGWVPVCALGSGAALGEQPEGADLALRAVGESLPAITWPADGDRRSVGCSADGSFAYLRSGAALERVSLSDGSRDEVVEGLAGGPAVWTR